MPDAGMNWIVLVHSLWFVAIIAEERTLGPSFEQLPLQALFAALFVGAELTRFWCISALGDRWNIRIVIHPGEGLVCSGPYRYLKHPNYVAATVLIGAMPLALGLPYTALASVPLKLLAVISRVRVENKRLAEC